MAEFLTTGLIENGVDAQSYDVLYNELGQLKEILDESDGFMLGSPTINRDALKPIWDLLSATDAITNKGKPCFAFGSYGWSGEAVPMLIERLKSLKLNVIGEGYKVCFMPNELDYVNLKQLAAEFAGQLK